jgi:hypothetical protein
VPDLAVGRERTVAGVGKGAGVLLGGGDLAVPEPVLHDDDVRAAGEKLGRGLSGTLCKWRDLMSAV